MQLNRPKVSFQGRTKVLLLCFLIATIFWFFHAMDTNHTAIISYPVRVHVLSNNESIRPSETIKSKFKISIYGNGWGLLSKIIGRGIPPIEVEKNAAKEMTVTSKEYRETMMLHLKSFRVNYIFPDSLDIASEYFEHE